MDGPSGIPEPPNQPGSLNAELWRIKAGIERGDDLRPWINALVNVLIHVEQRGQRTLTDEDVARLNPLLEHAMAEVDASAAPDAMIHPDDGQSLMDGYDWAKGLRARLRGDHEADPWTHSRVKCRVCNYECESVRPVAADADHLECARCGRMTMEPVS